MFKKNFRALINTTVNFYLAYFMSSSNWQLLLCASGRVT